MTAFSVLAALDAAFTIRVEATTHVTASNLTNPLPGAWHLAGLIAVPALLLLSPLMLRGCGKPLRADVGRCPSDPGNRASEVG